MLVCRYTFQTFHPFACGEGLPHPAAAPALGLPQLPLAAVEGGAPHVLLVPDGLPHALAPVATALGLQAPPPPPPRGLACDQVCGPQPPPPPPAGAPLVCTIGC